MANRFSLSANISPTVDDAAAEQEAEGLRETFEDSIGDLDAGIGSVGSLGGARGGIGGGGGGVGGAGGSIGGIASAASGGGLLSVALGGVVGFGLLTGVQQLAGASPALSRTASILGDAFDLFFRPLGQELAGVLGPFAEAGLDMAKNFNDVYETDGLGVAILSLGGNVATTFATGVASAVEDVITGSASGADLVTLGGATVAVSKVFSAMTWSSLLSLLPSIGIGSILTSVSAGGLTALLPSIGIGSVLTALGGAAGAAASAPLLAGLLGTVGIGLVLNELVGDDLANLLGSISVGKILESDDVNLEEKDEGGGFRIGVGPSAVEDATDEEFGPDGQQDGRGGGSGSGRGTEVTSGAGDSLGTGALNRLTAAQQRADQLSQEAFLSRSQGDPAPQVLRELRQIREVLQDGIVTAEEAESVNLDPYN